jgi:hypothetical protein
VELRTTGAARATRTVAAPARGLATHQDAQTVLTLADQFLDLGHLVAATRTLRLLIVAALIASGIAPGALTAPLRRLFATLAVISAAPGALSRH